MVIEKCFVRLILQCQPNKPQITNFVRILSFLCGHVVIRFWRWQVFVKEENEADVIPICEECIHVCRGDLVEMPFNLSILDFSFLFFSKWPVPLISLTEICVVFYHKFCSFSCDILILSVMRYIGNHHESPFFHIVTLWIQMTFKLQEFTDLSVQIFERNWSPIDFTNKYRSGKYTSPEFATLSEHIFREKLKICTCKKLPTWAYFSSISLNCLLFECV